VSLHIHLPNYDCKWRTEVRNGFLCIACSITLILGLGCGSDNGNSSKTPPDDTTQFSLSSGSYDFGANIVGNTVTQTVVTVKNLGNNPLTIAPALSGDASFSLASSQSCGTTVGVGVSCNEVVSYTGWRRNGDEYFCCGDTAEHHISDAGVHY